MDDELKEFMINLLKNANQKLCELGEEGSEKVESEKDIVTKADEELSNYLLSEIKEKFKPVEVFREEGGSCKIPENVEKPRYIIAIDELDGTDNFHRDKNNLPYCTVVTIFENPEDKELKFKHAIAAGIMIHNSEEIVYAVKGKGCYVIKDGEEKKVRVKNWEGKDNSKIGVLLDLYASTMPEKGDICDFSKIINDDQIWPKDFGSAAYHFASIAKGCFEAYVSGFQKADVLGAGYLLIKEAGGYITTFEGKDLGDEVYIFGRKYPIVAGCNEKLCKDLLDLVENKEKYIKACSES